jgi:Protein of unknown function (DUF4019)
MNRTLNLSGRMRVVLILATSMWFALATAQPAPPAATSAVPPAVQSGAPPTAADPVQPTMRDDKETIVASEKWLALLDGGKAGAAWDASSAQLQQQVTRKEWIAGISDVRKRFGKFSSRKAEKFARSHSLPGAPEGDYSIIEFESTYANGKKAQEQVIWTLETGDIWRVSGYFIR